MAYGQNQRRRLPNRGLPGILRCSLSLCCTARPVCFSRTGGSAQMCYACKGRRPRRPGAFYTASRGNVRGTITVSSTIERQRYAGPAATRTCDSGDPGCSLSLPSCMRGQGDTSPCRLSLWSARTISLSANRKEKRFLVFTDGSPNTIAKNVKYVYFYPL